MKPDHYMHGEYVKSMDVPRDSVFYGVEARWCMICARFHGVFYRCQFYPPSVLAEIDKQEKAYNSLLLNASRQTP